MKQSVKTFVSALICSAALKAGAMSGGSIIPVAAPAAPTTNLVQNIGLTLTAYTQGATTTNGAVVSQPVVKFKRMTKDVIKVLGDATANSFTAKAKLIMISPMGDGDSAIYVQDGTNRVDVTGFFSESDGSRVSAYSTNTVSHVEKETSYRLMRLRLHDSDTRNIALHFDISGFGTVTSMSIKKNKVIVGKSNDISANLAGSGEWFDGSKVSDLILQGTLTVTGTTVTVTP